MLGNQQRRVVAARPRARTLATSGQLVDALTAIAHPVAMLRCVRDPDGAVVDFLLTFVNDAAAEAMPQLREVVGTRLLDLMPEHPRDLFDAYVRVVETGAPMSGDRVRYDVTWGLRDGKPARLVNIRANKVDDGVAVSWTDVTDVATP